MRTIRRFFVAAEGYVNYELVYVGYVLGMLAAVSAFLLNVGNASFHWFGLVSFGLVSILNLVLPKRIVITEANLMITFFSVILFFLLTIARMAEHIGSGKTGFIILGIQCLSFSILMKRE